MAGHRLLRGRAETFEDQLCAAYIVEGPQASGRFFDDHIIVFREGDDEKLRPTDGYGGPEGANSGSVALRARVAWLNGRTSGSQMASASSSNAAGSR